MGYGNALGRSQSLGLGRDSNGRTRSNGLRAQTGIEPHMGQRRFVGEHNRMGKSEIQQVRGQSLHEGDLNCEAQQPHVTGP